MHCNFFPASLVDEDGMPSPPPHMRSLAEREHMRAMEAAHQVMEEAKKRMEEVHRSSAPPLIPPPHPALVPPPIMSKVSFW